MQDFRKRRGPRAELLRALLSVAGVLVVGALAFFAVRAAWGMYQKFAEASAASAAAEAELAALSQSRDKLALQTAELGTSRGVEGALRERYGVARPGEGEITVVEQAASTTGATAAGGWWEELWHALFVW